MSQLHGAERQLRDHELRLRDLEKKMSDNEVKPGSIDAAKAYTDEVARAAMATAEQRFEALAARVEELEEQIGAAKHDAAIARAHTEVLSENLSDRMRYLEQGAKGVAVPLYNVQREQGLHLEALDSHSDRIAKLEMRLNWLDEDLDRDLRIGAERATKLEQANRGLASQAGQCPHGWGDGCIDCDDANENDGPIGEPAQPIAGTVAPTAGMAPAPQRVPQSEAPIAIEVGQVWRDRRGEHHEVLHAQEPGWWRIRSAGFEGDANEAWFAAATLVEPAPKTEMAQLSWCRTCERLTPWSKRGAVWACADCPATISVIPDPPKQHWAANVPEPPPVGELLGAANLVEHLAVDSSGACIISGRHKTVASWLRSVAAAMGGGK